MFIESIRPRILQGALHDFLKIQVKRLKKTQLRPFFFFFLPVSFAEIRQLGT